MANFTYRTSEYSPVSIHTYKTFTTWSWNHLAPETTGNCTWYAFGESSRIVQECKNDSSYNIQYSSGNEIMASGTPDAGSWIHEAYVTGRWQTEGDTRGKIYNPSSSSLYGTQINIKDGDILCYYSSGSGHYGHLEIVERIVNGTVYCTGSKYGIQTPAVLYYERTVALNQFKVGTGHSFPLPSGGTWSGEYFQGVIHNPYVSGSTPPEPPTPTDDNIEILINCVVNKKKKKMRLIIE